MRLNLPVSAFSQLLSRSAQAGAVEWMASTDRKERTMRTNTRIIAAMSALSVAAGGGLSIAAAKTTHARQADQSTSSQTQRGPEGRRPPGPPFIKAAASYLGLDVKALCDQLHSGKTLAQVADAQGKSVDGLKQAIYDDAKSHLDKAVADGKITADQEQTRLSDLQSHLGDIVTKTPPKGGPMGQHGPPPAPPAGDGDAS
jgi:hypothetical protein